MIPAESEAIISWSYAKCMLDSRHPDEIACGITSVELAPDLKTLSEIWGSPVEGTSELLVSDCDGVITEASIRMLYRQIMDEKVNFNEIKSPEAKALIEMAQSRSIVLTTNRGVGFNRILEKMGARSLTDTVQTLDHGIQLVEGIDRQNPFINNNKKIVARIKSAISQTGYTTGKKTILRFVFDVRSGLPILINDLAMELGMPLELNSVAKIVNACKELGIVFDEIHIGMINPNLHEPIPTQRKCLEDP